MAVFIDPPSWPAHGTRWSHLISDTSVAELHGFARRLRLPRRSFDLDHYDVAESSYEAAVSAGARAVSGGELVRRLIVSGLRIRARDRDGARADARRLYLLQEWAALGGMLGIEDDPGPRRDAWDGLGDELVRRWNEPHRRYHDERHLEDVLLALDQLRLAGAVVEPTALLAAWFHDAVYRGREDDERASAALAHERIAAVLGPDAEATAVRDYVLATDPAAEVSEAPLPLAPLLDADLSVFAAGERRYRDYADAVREEYAHVDDADFRRGRARILLRYLDRPRIYRTDEARALWEQRARRNLALEIDRLSRSGLS